MCEIAILNPKRESTDRITHAARTLFESQRSSLGIVAVYNDTDGFDYQVYKAVNPNFETVRDFVGDRMDCYRFFLHGRLATHGDVTIDNAHPLKIKDDNVDIDMILHNGIVLQHEQLKQQHIAEGHEYSTDVDSEVIAHSFGEIPDNVDDAARMNNHSNERAFVLFNNERILIYTNGQYQLSESVEMSHGHRQFGCDQGDGGLRYMLVFS